MSEAILPIRVDDHYWIVADDESRLWSSARAAYVAPDDAAYAAWQSSGAVATRIASEAELDVVIEAAAFEPRAAVTALRQGLVREAVIPEAALAAETPARGPKSAG
ncbi:MAG: hypothetical protein KDK07_11810 [Bauldia sp.]|nr:hypothetical protein [Bauldia sp.]